MLWASLILGCGDGRVSVADAPPPTLADPTHLRLVALGDAGHGDAGQARVAAGVVQVCAERGCDLILLLGDNVYPRGLEGPTDPRAEALIAAPYREAGVPVYLVLGNHDYGHGRALQRADWQIEWARDTAGVELPAHAWKLRAGPVELVGLDTNAAMQFGSSFQTKWLQDALAASDAPWKVVVGHHPFRSDGRHGNAGAYDGWSHVPIVSGGSLLDLFTDGLCGRADLYLSGHDHNLQLTSRCGVDLVVTGAGSATTPLVDRGNEPRFSSTSLGLAYLDLGPSAGELLFLDAEGQVQAAFSLTP